jgi:uncharacterized membrane protein (DUF4010 family)
MLSAGTVALRFAVALGIGLLIGIERERRKGKGPLRGAAGIRTFALASLLGAVSLQVGREPLLIATALVIGGLTVASYLRTSRVRQKGLDPGLTTESALLLTVILGALAMRGPALASAIGVVVAILLAARNRLHVFVRSILSEEELQQTLIFAAAVVVILPLLPNRFLGPFGILNPRTIWKFVVLMMSVSAAGYVAMRALGVRFGLPLAGLASGFASSAATIATMGSRAQEQAELAKPATAGAVLSSIATIVELAVVLRATDHSILTAIRLPLIAAGVAAVIYGAAFTARTLSTPAAKPAAKGSVFDLKTTGILAATVAAVTFVSGLMNAKFGQTGITAAAALAGFGDAHAAAVSVASLAAAGKLTTDQAILPILAAVTTNTITKGFLAFSAGGPDFAVRVVPGLTLMIAALWMTFLA